MSQFKKSQNPYGGECMYFTLWNISKAERKQIYASLQEIGYESDIRYYASLKSSGIYPFAYSVFRFEGSAEISAEAVCSVSSFLANRGHQVNFHHPN